MKLKNIQSVLVLCFGGFYARATPDLIPNSEVKPCSSDDTLLEGKVASRQNTELKPKKIPTTPVRAVRRYFFGFISPVSRWRSHFPLVKFLEGLHSGFGAPSVGPERDGDE